MVSNPSLFSSKDYLLYRFDYPDTLFAPLRSTMGPLISQDAIQVLDLGCGTGLVTESFLRSAPRNAELHLVDIDVPMLAEAKERFRETLSVKTFHATGAENIPHPDCFFDLVLIGSAWHWMHPSRALEEIERVLKPGGAVFIFEYQFPKAVSNSALNDWIRVQFNTEWKPETQVPRGNLKELTQCWRDHSHFSQLNQISFFSTREHQASELAGVICSQSRYQHFEQRLAQQAQIAKRKELTEKLDQLLSGKSSTFSYYYEGYLFKKCL